MLAAICMCILRDNAHKNKHDKVSKAFYSHGLFCLHDTSSLMTMIIRALLSVALISTLAACQHLPTQPQQTTPINAATPMQFKISGKIGVVYVDANQKKHSGSAFFAWVQEGQRFAIDLTGALGIGKTYIEGTPTYAKLINQNTGEIVGDTPEDILYQATKWHAPISMLPQWIMARPTQNHTKTSYDEQGRLQTTREADWQATLSYKDGDNLPYKLKMLDDANNKVIITLQTRE